MGVKPDCVFAFRVAELENPHLKPIVPERVPTLRDMGWLKHLGRRMQTDSDSRHPSGAECERGRSSRPDTPARTPLVPHRLGDLWRTAPRWNENRKTDHLALSAVGLGRPIEFSLRWLG